MIYSNNFLKYGSDFLTLLFLKNVIVCPFGLFKKMNYSDPRFSILEVV